MQPSLQGYVEFPIASLNCNSIPRPFKIKCHNKFSYLSHFQVSCTTALLPYPIRQQYNLRPFSHGYDMTSTYLTRRHRLGSLAPASSHLRPAPLPPAPAGPIDDASAYFVISSSHAIIDSISDLLLRLSFSLTHTPLPPLRQKPPPPPRRSQPQTPNPSKRESIGLCLPRRICPLDRSACCARRACPLNIADCVVRIPYRARNDQETSLSFSLLCRRMEGRTELRPS